MATEGVNYAGTPQEIANLVAELHKSSEQGEVVGLDTEFSGVEIGKQSVYGRSRIHLASFAIPRRPHQLQPRGFNLADAWVVRWTPGVQEVVGPWLQSESPKAVHNSSVDVLSFSNHGVQVGGVINTLDLARWAWPGRARGGEGGFTLDALGRDILGEGKTESYADIFSYPHTELMVSFRRLKSGLQKEVVREVKTIRWIPLESVVPGHPLWERVVGYAARDAVLGLGVYDVAMEQIRRTRRYMPW